MHSLSGLASLGEASQCQANDAPARVRFRLQPSVPNSSTDYASYLLPINDAIQPAHTRRIPHVDPFAGNEVDAAAASMAMV